MFGTVPPLFLPCPPSQTCQKTCTSWTPFEQTGVPEKQHLFMTVVCPFYRCAWHNVSTVPTLSLRFCAPFLHRPERSYFASCCAPPRMKPRTGHKKTSQIWFIPISSSKICSEPSANGNDKARPFEPVFRPPHRLISVQTGPPHGAIASETPPLDTPLQSSDASNSCGRRTTAKFDRTISGAQIFGSQTPPPPLPPVKHSPVPVQRVQQRTTRASSAARIVAMGWYTLAAAYTLALWARGPVQARRQGGPSSWCRSEGGSANRFEGPGLIITIGTRFRPDF